MLVVFVLGVASLGVGIVAFVWVVRELVRHGSNWAWSHFVGVVLFFGLCLAGWGAAQTWRSPWGPRDPGWRAVGAAIAFGFLLAVPSVAMALLVRRLDSQHCRKQRDAKLTHEAFTAIQAWRRRQAPPSDTGAGSASTPDPTDDPGA